MMSESLLRLGHGQTAAEYLDWYTPYSFEMGRSVLRGRARRRPRAGKRQRRRVHLPRRRNMFHSGSSAARANLAPVEAAAAYMERLRQSERSERNLSPSGAPLRLMPPSSVEGYSEKAAYAYGTILARIGIRASEIAEALGRLPDENAWTPSAMVRKELYESLARAR